MKLIRKLLGEIARLIAFVVVILVANLLAAYIIAGIAFRGDWVRVDKAIERAYDEYFDN